jgi:hypothetical protein
MKKEFKDLKSLETRYLGLMDNFTALEKGV